MNEAAESSNTAFTDYKYILARYNSRKTLFAADLSKFCSCFFFYMTLDALSL